MFKILCISFGLLFASPDPEPWTLKKQENNISVFTRSLPGKSFKEYKAVTKIQCSLESVLDELLTAPQYSAEFMPGISYSIKEEDRKHLFYAYQDLPWPLRDRDVVSQLTVEMLSKDTYKLTISGAPEALPEKEKALRIHDLTGFWLLERDGTTIKVTQQLYVDPEGSLPAIVVNGLLVDGPFKTFLQLRQKLDEQAN